MKAGKNRQIRYPDFYTLLVQIQKPIFRAHSRGVARLSSLRLLGRIFLPQAQ